MAEHEDLMQRAIAAEAAAQRAALDGEEEGAAAGFAEAAALYRASWEVAPPRAFGRLVGLLKAAIQAGSGSVEARYVASELREEPDSPASWYAAGLAALVLGDDDRAGRAAEGMREGSDAFGRAADAMAALAAGDEAAYGDAVRAIVADFEGRDDHLTGVAFCDTAAMFERLAAPRGLGAGVSSALLPPAGG